MSDHTGSGWTCATCGVFVPMNQWHDCPGFRVGSVPAAPRPTPIDQTEEALRLLRLIADDLAKIERLLSGRKP